MTVVKRCHWCHTVGNILSTNKCNACGRTQPIIGLVDRFNSSGKRLLDTEINSVIVKNNPVNSSRK